jgi:phospholipid transport system transporter-binding protein
MSDASIHETSPGELSLAGVLDYRSGPLLREAGKALIEASTASELVIDCARVEKSSSVGLSLLLSFMRDAQALRKSLKIRALPGDMRQIAEVCQLTEILPLLG